MYVTTDIKDLYVISHVELNIRWRVGMAPENHGHGWGSAPYGQSDSTSRLWARSGQFKTTRECARSLSWRSLDSLEHGLNISWISELSGTPRSYASRFRNCALQRAPVRWTLALKTNHLWGPGPCQSRTITEQRVETHVRGRAELPRRNPNRPRDSEASQQSFPEQHVETHVKTKPKHPACFNSESK